MKIFGLVGMCMIILISGCSTTHLEDIHIYVEESNMSMSKPYANTNMFGDVTYISFPSPNDDVFIEFINETYVRLFNRDNQTIGYDDVSDGNIRVESPPITCSIDD